MNINMNNLMQQAQSMQKKMQDMQSEIASKEFEGKSGGGLVSIIINGKNEMKNVNIDSSLTKDIEILEDLIVAAYNDAKSKLDQESKNSANGAFGNIASMMPGMNF